MRYEEPHPDTVADKATYAKLQREAQAREDWALVVPLATLIQPPKEPRFVNGRWVYV